MVRRRNYKIVERTQDVSAIASDATADIEELAGEMQNWYEGMPENLQGSAKGEEVYSAQTDLEQIDTNFDVTTVLEDIEVKYQEFVPYGRKGPSRARRAANISMMLGAAAETVREHFVQEDNPDEYLEAEGLADQFQKAADELDNISFPSMFG